jgi:hypothetical protein
VPQQFPSLKEPAVSADLAASPDDVLSGSAPASCATPDTCPWLFQPTHEEVAGARTDRDRQILERWYGNLRKLAEYRDAHGGSCEVPQCVRPLGTWCNKQRNEYKLYREGGGKEKTRMTRRRIEALEAVGFQWASPKGDPNWIGHYRELLSILRTRGSIRGIPLRFDKKSSTRTPCNGSSSSEEVFGLSASQIKALGRWITEQRKQKVLWDQRYAVGDNDGDPPSSSSSSNLTAERIEMLERIGFDWGRPRGYRRRPQALPPPVSSASSSPPRNL